MTPFQQIARSMHPISSRKKWLAVFQAYFDESGHESDCHVVAFAGLLAPYKNWERLELKWKARLRRAGLDPDSQGFHAADFHGNHKPFDTYKWKDEYFKSSFFSDLGAIIDQTVSFAIIHAVVVKDWTQIMGPILTPYEKRRACYVFLMMMCLGDMYLRIKGDKKHEKIACIFDRKKEVEHYARSFFYKMKEDHSHLEEYFEGADWKDRLSFVPLQAADMVAYEGYQATLNFEVNKTMKMRSQFRQIFSNLDRNDRINIHWHNEDKLTKFSQREFE